MKLRVLPAFILNLPVERNQRVRRQACSTRLLLLLHRCNARRRQRYSRVFPLHTESQQRTSGPVSFVRYNNLLASRRVGHAARGASIIWRRSTGPRSAFAEGTQFKFTS